jgi:hypothetical protein
VSYQGLFIQAGLGAVGGFGVRIVRLRVLLLQCVWEAAAVVNVVVGTQWSLVVVDVSSRRRGRCSVWFGLVRWLWSPIVGSVQLSGIRGRRRRRCAARTFLSFAESDAVRVAATVSW